MAVIVIGFPSRIFCILFLFPRKQSGTPFLLSVGIFLSVGILIILREIKENCDHTNHKPNAF